MANPFPFGVIDYYLSHSGTDFSFIETVFVAMTDDEGIACLYIGLAIIVFITNICVLVKLRRKDNQVAILNVQ